MARPSLVEVVAATDLPVAEPAKSPGKPPGSSFPPSPRQEKDREPPPRIHSSRKFCPRGLSPEFVAGLAEEIKALGQGLPREGGHRNPALVTFGGN